MLNFFPTPSPIQDHLLSITDFNVDQINQFLDFVAQVETHCDDVVDILKGKVLATLFFEPSTRTRLSFETAMFRCGGQVISVEDGNTSSFKKGETLEDMGKVVSQYADLIVVRHPERLSCYLIAKGSDVPVINAGDGDHEHPSQALLDLYTILKQKKDLNGLRVGFFGDLKYARSAHSTIKALAKYDTSFTFISHSDFNINDDIKASLKDRSCEFLLPNALEDALSYCDVLYVTRLQKERFKSDQLHENVFLSKDHLQQSKSDLMILHPLPRIDEIDKDIDNDPKAFYFKQARNGVFVRMALLLLLLKSA